MFFPFYVLLIVKVHSSFNQLMISLSENTSSLTLSEDTCKLRDAIEVIQNSKEKIALVIDCQNRLVGTLTDGDIRRALLSGNNLDSPIKECANKTLISINQNLENRSKQASEIIKKEKIRQLPVVSSDGSVVSLYFVDESVYSLPNSVVLMAGGKGTRLRPHTFNCPKPMIPVGNKPMLEILLEQLIQSGLVNFYISVNYLKEQVINYFGDGSKWGVNINYLIETDPLGTAGSLGLLPKELSDPFIVMNGDVLTKLNPCHLLSFHNEHQAKATLCVREHSVTIPFGVVKNKGKDLIDFEEKPTFEYLINAGVYILDPSIISLIPQNESIDMPSLLLLVKDKGLKVAICPIHEYWIDIGNPKSLKEANSYWEISPLL